MLILLWKISLKKEGIEYEETFLSVAMLKSIKIILFIVAYLEYEIW